MNYAFAKNALFATVGFYTACASLPAADSGLDHHSPSPSDRSPAEAAANSLHHRCRQRNPHKQAHMPFAFAGLSLTALQLKVLDP